MTYINIDNYEHTILEDGEIVFHEAVYVPLPYTDIETGEKGYTK